jgi:2-polyprenyl-6-methoxyphenol hydroxylase-like FAD-dependent oxidoreductase
LLIMIDRGDYFQIGFVIRKGSVTALRDQGIEAFRHQLRDIVPWLGDRVERLQSFDEIRLLTVELSRLPRWYRDGLLCIGDAAHAMSPVGGIGINLAVQDAVAAGRVLAAAAATRCRATRSLRKIQLRRWAPTVLTQTFQRVAHRFVVATALPTKKPRRGRRRPLSAPTTAAVSRTADGSGLLRGYRSAAGACAGFRSSESTASDKHRSPVTLGQRVHARGR